MSDRDIELEIRTNDLFELRKNYYNPPNFLQSLIAKLTTNTWYATRPILFDFSHWQSKPDGTTSVDWDTLKAQGASGGYVKLGEVFDWGTEDDWMDKSCDSNLNALAKNKMLAGAYCFLNTAWPVNEGFTTNDYDKVFEQGATELDVATQILKYDKNVHLIVRKIKIGGAWMNGDTASLKTAPNRRIHFIVLDVERWWNFYPTSTAKAISPVWIELVTKKVAERLQWLMDKGYLPQLKILIYSGKWFIDAYCPQLENRAQFYDTICAGYYWKESYPVGTLTEIIKTYLPQIPDNWRPKLFGANPRIFQFAVPKVNGMASDMNIFNGTLDQMRALFPAWNDWGATPVPEPSSSPSPSAQIPEDDELHKLFLALSARVDTHEARIEQLDGQQTLILNRLLALENKPDYDIKPLIHDLVNTLSKYT